MIKTQRSDGMICASLVAGALLLGACSTLFAVPACPNPVTIRQPAGPTVRVHLKGDEFLHWHEDEAGYSILPDPQSGNWVYALKDSTGRLVPSSAVVGRDRPERLGIPRKLQADGVVSNSVGRRMSRYSSTVTADGVARVPRTGVMKNLVLLVEFADKPHIYSRADIEALFNTVGYTADGAAGSVKDYYHEVSYNALDVDSVVVEWITLDQGYAYYGANDAFGDDVRPREMVAEALAKLEARGFDFSTLDADNDGQVDGLTVIHAGGGEEYSGNDSQYIWSHQWQMLASVTYDGKTLHTYHTEPERRGWDDDPGSFGLTRIGVICHETGHFLGLPDLYDYDYDSQGAGDFCLMAGGSWNGDNGTLPSHPSAWCKSVLDWVTPVTIIAAGLYSAPRIEDQPVAFRVGQGFPSSQYFLVENRQGFGFDAGLPGVSRGLLIWHIDETQANNDDQTHYQVDLEEASGIQHLELDANSGDDADYFRDGTLTAFNSNTVPNSRSYGGVSLERGISAVSSAGTTMTFTIDDPNSPSQFTATSMSRERIDLAWQPNSSNDPVLVAWSSNGIFGVPAGVLQVNDSILGGGIVLYRGSAGAYSHTGLTAQTPYFYRAWSVLTGAHYSAAVSAAGRTAHPVPVTENFENGGVRPSAWTEEFLSGSLPWAFQGGGHKNRPARAHGGSYNAFLFVADYSSPRTRLITPAIDFGTQTRNAQLTFWHCMQEWAGDQDYLSVYYQAAPDQDWILLAHYSNTVSAWTQRTLTLPMPGSASRIGFDGFANYGYGVCVDDVQVSGESRLTPAVIRWPTASGIVFGQTVADSMLTGGTGSVAGTFIFTAPQTAPPAGVYAASVTFIPDLVFDYQPVIGTAFVTVARATPSVVTLPTAGGIIVGQPLADSVLQGGEGSVPGSFVFSQPATEPPAGRYSAELTFLPSDTNNYASLVAGSVDITIVGPPDFAGGGIQRDELSGLIRFLFTAVDGIEYRILYTDDLLLTNAWIPLVPPDPDGWTNGAGEITIEDIHAVGVTQRFYRMEIR